MHIFSISFIIRIGVCKCISSISKYQFRQGCENSIEYIETEKWGNGV